MSKNPKFILNPTNDLLLHVIYNQLEANEMLKQILAKIGGAPTLPSGATSGEPFAYSEPYIIPPPKKDEGTVQVV
jgi:hypothetical protein